MWGIVQKLAHLKKEQNGVAKQTEQEDQTRTDENTNSDVCGESITVEQSDTNKDQEISETEPKDVNGSVDGVAGTTPKNTCVVCLGILQEYAENEFVQKVC